MNRNEVRALLMQRARATNQRFDDSTVETWHQVLRVYETHKVMRAFEICLRDGIRMVGVSDICGRITRDPLETDMTEAISCECHRVGSTFVLCDAHRTTGRNAINRIRSEHGWV